MSVFTDRLGIGEGGTTVIIGSGGKTSLLYALADELPGRIVLGTTTHIRPSDEYKTLTDPTPEQIRSDWARVLCAGHPAPDGKLTAPEGGWERLRSCGDHLLLEGDGARERPLKAHAPWEPVIPPFTDCLVCVVGASGFGQPVAEAVHRPERWTKPDTSPESVAAMLARELCVPLSEGGTAPFGRAELAGIPLTICVNQCDSAERLDMARRLAARLPFPVVAGSIKKRELSRL